MMLDLTQRTIECARLALHISAHDRAEKAIEFIARGSAEAAGYAARTAYRRSRAWDELCIAATESRNQLAAKSQELTAK